MSKQLKISDNLIYEFNSKDVFVKDENTYEFVSLKKITTFKNNKKYQNITIKHEHFEEFRKWILDILTEGSDF